jgi:hypothetical protein
MNPIKVIPGDTLNFTADVFISPRSLFGAASPEKYQVHLLVDNEGLWCLLRASVTKDGKVINISESREVVFEKGEFLRAKTPRFYKGGDRKPVRKARKKAG